MNLTKKTLATLLLLPLPLVGFISRGDAVAFAPEAGTSVSKALTLEATFYLDDLSMVLDGQDMPAEMMGGGMDQALLMSVAIAVTDEYVKTRGGKTLNLLRTYDELALEVGVESDADDVEEFTELEGSTVAFEWNSETGEYDKSYHETDGDEDLLEHLKVDMDFLALLPDDEVSEGDTWELKGVDIQDIFFPGGMPAGDGGMDDNADAEEMKELLKEELEGQMKDAFDDFAINCTYTGAKEEGGVSVGVIEFKFEGEADFDLTELILAAIDLQAGEMGIEADLTATVGMEFEGEGTLLWNMADGHVSGFDMDCEIIVAVDIEGEVDAMGESHSFELSAEVSGEAEWAMEVDAE